MRQAERDRGLDAGLSTEERERLKALEREVRDELRQANEILRKASAYFAQAELDRRSKPSSAPSTPITLMPLAMPIRRKRRLGHGATSSCGGTSGRSGVRTAESTVRARCGASSAAKELPPLAARWRG